MAVHMTATVVQICDYFNGKKGNLPVIVNVQNRADYRAILDRFEFAQQICISEYFGSKQFPDTEKMCLDVLSAESNVVVIGLFQYFCLNGGATAITNTLSKIINADRKVLVLTYGLKDIIEKKLEKDVRLKERAHIYFVEGPDEGLPKVSLTSFDFKGQNYYGSLKDYLVFLEKNGGADGVVKSKFSAKAFNDGVWSVTKQTTAFELLKERDERFAEFDEDYGTNTQWEDLMKDGEWDTFRDLLSTQNIDPASPIKKFKEYNELQKWLVFLFLKSERNKGYLSLVSKKANSANEVISAVYNAILDVDPKHKSFKDYYLQRKELIISLEDKRSLKEFLNLYNSKERDKVLYLTDVTETERKEILKCFTQYEYTLEEMRRIAQMVYPLLAEYLSPFEFNEGSFNSYFEDYKVQKVRNVLTDEFKLKVEENAKNRPFYDLPTRASVISRIKDDNAIIYWVDALGAEFCGYINQRCKHYGLSAKIKIARSELPTLTEFNKDFAPLTAERIIKDLDNLKHDGVGDHDYSKSPLPLYIESELEIIDNIIKNAHADLADKKKVIILSDHGASRLVRIADNVLTIKVDTKEGEKDEKHGGRCCAWDPEVPKQFDTVTDSPNNGFCVIANYDRFKGGRYTGVELHGGATLEEVVVPIIEITNRTTIDYKHTLKSSTLTLRGRNADPLTISLSSEVKAPKIKIKDRNEFIVPTKVEGSTYTFETNITKSGKYECAFFDGNEEIINGITFEVRSALGGINDLI